MLAESIVKIISKNKDKLCEVLLNDIYDEDENKYSDVYVYEIQEFLNGLESDLSDLEEKNIKITSEIIVSLIIVSWGCGIYCENLAIYNYVNELLEQAKRDLIQLKDFRINDNEKIFINKLLSGKIESNQKILINLIIEPDDSTTKVLLDLKENNKEHYDSIIEDLKKDYIMGLNLQYKLFNKKSSDWGTGNSLHKSVCDRFNIDRNEFLF